MADLQGVLERTIRRNWSAVGSIVSHPKDRLISTVSVDLRADMPMGIRPVDMISDLQAVLDALPDFLAYVKEKENR